MAESLVVRVKRLVSANVTDVIDRMEKSQAEIVMKEAVREVERALDDIRSEQGKVMLRQVQASNQISAYTAKITEMSDKMDFAIAQGRDDLAKAAIARQVELEAKIKTLDQAVRDADVEQEKLSGFLVALEARKQDMDSELRTIVQSKAEVDAALPETSPKQSPMKRADHASEAFKRAMDSASNLPPTKSLNPEHVSRLAELDQLSHDALIEQRLQIAKSQKSVA